MQHVRVSNHSGRQLISSQCTNTSSLIRKLEGTQAVGGRMPQGGPFLDQAAMDTIKDWIDDGAPNNQERGALAVSTTPDEPFETRLAAIANRLFSILSRIAPPGCSGQGPGSGANNLSDWLCLRLILDLVGRDRPGST